MPRFFFDVDGGIAEPDDGLEMADADTACRAAFVAAAAMLKDEAARGGAIVLLVVRGEDGRRSCRVTAHLKVTKH